MGQLKFMFPNRHDVYMHDTPSKNLFASSVRTFSHGCIRVRNPRRLAEVIFANDRNWTARDISAKLQSRIENNRVELAQPIPVHNVYFTLVADEKGGLGRSPTSMVMTGAWARRWTASRSSASRRPTSPAAWPRRSKAWQSGGTSGRVAVRRPAPRRYAAEDPYGWAPSYGWGPPSYGRAPPRRSGYAPSFFPFFFGN